MESKKKMTDLHIRGLSAKTLHELNVIAAVMGKSRNAFIVDLLEKVVEHERKRQDKPLSET